MPFGTGNGVVDAVLEVVVDETLEVVVAGCEVVDWEAAGGAVRPALEEHAAATSTNNTA